MTYGQWLQINIINEGLSLSIESDEKFLLDTEFSKSNSIRSVWSSSMLEYVKAILIL